MKPLVYHSGFPLCHGGTKGFLGAGSFVPFLPFLPFFGILFPRSFPGRAVGQRTSLFTPRAWSDRFRDPKWRSCIREVCDGHRADAREWSLNLCLSSECLRVVQISNHRALESLQGHHQQRLQGHQQQRLNKAIVEEYRKPQTNQSPLLHRPTRAVECTPSMPSWRRSD